MMKSAIAVIEMRIPYSFAKTCATLGWRQVRYGLSIGLLDPGAGIDKAIDLICEMDGSSPDVLELAGSARSDRTLHIVDRLAEAESADLEGDLLALWAYLSLAWVYEHRHYDNDPLQRVIEIISDFDYPAGVAGFVRYMPTDEPDLGSIEANERRMLERWKEYLDESRRAFLKQSD